MRRVFSSCVMPASFTRLPLSPINCVLTSVSSVSAARGDARLIVHNTDEKKEILCASREHARCTYRGCACLPACLSTHLALSKDSLHLRLSYDCISFAMAPLFLFHTSYNICGIRDGRKINKRNKRKKRKRTYTVVKEYLLLKHVLNMIVT